jgi:hypothetical protein
LLVWQGILLTILTGKLTILCAEKGKALHGLFLVMVLCLFLTTPVNC